MAIKVEVFSTSTCPHCPAAIDAAEKAKAKLGDAIDVKSTTQKTLTTDKGQWTTKSWQFLLL